MSVLAKKERVVDHEPTCKHTIVSGGDPPLTINVLKSIKIMALHDTFTVTIPFSLFF